MMHVILMASVVTVEFTQFKLNNNSNVYIRIQTEEISWYVKIQVFECLVELNSIAYV